MLMRLVLYAAALALTTPALAQQINHERDFQEWCSESAYYYGLNSPDCDRYAEENRRVVQEEEDEPEDALFPSRKPAPPPDIEVAPVTNYQSFEEYESRVTLVVSREVCEKLLVNSLKAPSTARWQWQGMPTVRKWRGLLNSNRPYSFAFAAVDAQNSFGATIRSTFVCYARHAKEGEEEVWQLGHLRYGYCYATDEYSCSSKTFTQAPASNLLVWGSGDLNGRGDSF